MDASARMTDRDAHALVRTPWSGAPQAASPSCWTVGVEGLSLLLKFELSAVLLLYSRTALM